MSEKNDTRGRPRKYEKTKDAMKVYRKNLKADGMVAITTYVPKETKKLLEMFCKETGKTQCQVLSCLLDYASGRRDEFIALIEKSEEKG